MNAASFEHLSKQTKCVHKMRDELDAWLAKAEATLSEYAQAQTDEQFEVTS